MNLLEYFMPNKGNAELDRITSARLDKAAGAAILATERLQRTLNELLVAMNGEEDVTQRKER